MFKFNILRFLIMINIKNILTFITWLKYNGNKVKIWRLVMKEEEQDTTLNIEKENGIQFAWPFKWILATTIGLTGLISFGGIVFFIVSISNQDWNREINNFLYRSLFYISIILIFIALVNIAINKRTFTKLLEMCILAIGIIFVISSVIFPRIPHYVCSDFIIFQNGKFTLIDGTFLLIGILGILFSKLIQYGFYYQKISDMTL